MEPHSMTEDVFMSRYSVSISRPLARKALVLSFFPNAALYGLTYYSILFFLIWVVVAGVDTYNNQGYLISQHGYALLASCFLTFLFTSIWSFNHRKKTFLATDYWLEVNSDGITIYLNDISRRWEDFSHYREFADYLLLVSTSKTMTRSTVLPKTEDLAPALDIIRQNIPRKGFA
jgi:hypothetical protein